MANDLQGANGWRNYVTSEGWGSVVIQAGLFAPPPPPVPRRSPRWYQREALEALEASLEVYKSTLLVMATGLGKTATFAWLAKEWRKKGMRILVLAHTEELVEQNRATLQQVLGEDVFVEQGEQRCPIWASVVSGSFQSVRQPKRLERLGHDRFDLIIVDECHHILATTYLRVIEFFSTAKVVGVTATPDRGDEQALGRVFQDVAYVMDIMDGIDSGFLVPIEAYDVDCDVDLSVVSARAGDLAIGELDEAVFKGVEGIVQKTLELEPDRAGIMFFPGVRSAEAACEVFNKYRPDSACFLHGGTPPDLRKFIVEEFKAGKFQYLCNCQIATEGFDAPHVSLIGMGRMTKSRALAAQMAGRGTRPLPGVVDKWLEREDALRRQLAIRMSDKPDMVLLNFVGNAGRHELVSPSDILGGSFTPAEIKVAKKKAKEAAKAGEEYDVAEGLREARSFLRAMAQNIEARVVAKVTKWDVFKVVRTEESENDLRVRERFGTRPPDRGQVRLLKAYGMSRKEIGALDRRAASKAIRDLIRRKNQGLATLGQLKRLAQFGIQDENIRYDAAQRAERYLRGKNWGKKEIDPEVLNQLLGRSES